MAKRQLKKIYREYIYGTGNDGYKEKDGSSWEDMIPVFAFGLTEKERDGIHQDWLINGNKKTENAA